MKVRLRASARRDLREIWDYGAARHGEELADAYLRDVDAALARLADYPELGAPRADLGPDLRSLPVREHRIFIEPGGAGEEGGAQPGVGEPDREGRRLRLAGDPAQAGGGAGGAGVGAGGRGELGIVSPEWSGMAAGMVAAGSDATMQLALGAPPRKFSYSQSLVAGFRALK